MINYTSQHQIKLELFKHPFETYPFGKLHLALLRIIFIIAPARVFEVY